MSPDLKLLTLYNAKAQLEGMELNVSFVPKLKESLSIFRHFIAKSLGVWFKVNGTTSVKENG